MLVEELVGAKPVEHELPDKETQEINDLLKKHPLMRKPVLELLNNFKQ